jgi:hypothetical protein
MNMKIKQSDQESVFLWGGEVKEMVDWGRGYGATTPSHLGL